MENLHNGHRKRLRQQYDLSGEAGMPDHILLELLLSYAIPRRDVNPLAHTMLKKLGSLENVFTAKPEALEAVDGVGKETALLIRLVGDLHRRLSVRQEIGQKRRLLLSTPDLACRYALSLCEKDTYETARMICLNNAMQVISVVQLSAGTTDTVIFDPRRVIEQTLFYNAAGVILLHNHPSGTACPSESDIQTAERIDDLLSMLHFKIFDQLIIGDNAVYSFNSDKVFSFPGPNETKTYTMDEYYTLLLRNNRLQREANAEGTLFENAAERFRIITANE